MATDLARWMTTSEAARHLRVSRQRIDQLVREGAVAALMVAGRRLVYRSDVDNWRETRRLRRAWRPYNLEELRVRRDEILHLAKQHSLASIRVFGSVARGDARLSSDVDLLVSRAGATALDVAEFATDLEDLLGCRVDVIVDAGRGAAIDRIRASAVAL